MNRLINLIAAAGATAAAGLFVAGAVLAQISPAQPSVTQTPATVRAAAAAAAGAQNSASDETEIRRILGEKFQGLEVTTITKSPYFGLYEVFAGDQIVYTDAKVSYVMVGNVIDPNTRGNLTEERLQQLKAIAISDLPLDQAIKIVKGTGEKKFVVFSDADCPYCKQFERTLTSVDNYTAYILLYPIDQLHPDAARKSRMIWCAPDREKSWLDFMLRNQLPTNDGNCETPLPRLLALAQKYKVVATPTIVFMDGRVIPGALPKDRLEREIARADAAVASKVSKN